MPDDPDIYVLRSTGPIDVKLTSPTESLYGTRSEDRRFGIKQTIGALNAVSADFHSKTLLRMGVGDISKLGGGQISGHASHRKGVDVDIRLPRNDGREADTTYKSSSYSRASTQILVDYFRYNNIFPVKFIFFNDAQVSHVSPWPHHDDHLHVRFDITKVSS